MLFNSKNQKNVNAKNQVFTEPPIHKFSLQSYRYSPQKTNFPIISQPPLPSTHNTGAVQVHLPILFWVHRFHLHLTSALR